MTLARSQRVSKGFWTTGRIAGTLLVFNTLFIAAEFIMVIAHGNIEGIPAAWEGVEEIGEKASVFRTVAVFRGPEILLLFLGFGLLTVYLNESGDKAVPFLAFNLFIVFLILSAIEDTFHSELTAWAGEEWARRGTIPEFFEPLREWVNGTIQLRYVTFANVSMVFYGWAFLRTKVLPRWIGWGTLGWSLGWLILTPSITLPATLVILPLVIGVALLLYPSRELRSQLQES